MRTSIVLLTSAALLGGFVFDPATATAQDDKAAAALGSPIGGNDLDPGILLDDIHERRKRSERESLLPVSPLKGVHDAADALEDALYDAIGLKFGVTVNHLFQGMSDAVADLDRWGTTTDMDIVGSWALWDVGKPTQGQLYFHLEGRWDYGTTGPQNLGFVNLASIIGTGNAFSAYRPTFLPFRNLYWEQGSAEAGWAFRAGKITPDAILATSRHITPVTTFLPNGGTGLFSSGYPDSGVGAVGVLYLNDDLKLLGLVSDANADRYNWGNPGAGDYYKAFEVHARLFNKTEKAEFSKLTFWHQPETGKTINAQTGEKGWGMTVKHEMEFTEDGRGVGIFRWGRSWKESSFYKQQAGAHFLYYDPGWIGTIKNDVVGTAFNWVEPNDSAGGRDEYNLEAFYRFPFFPGVDTTLSYQSVFDPAFNTEFDHAHVFSVRLRTTF